MNFGLNLRKKDLGRNRFVAKWQACKKASPALTMCVDPSILLTRFRNAHFLIPYRFGMVKHNKIHRVSKDGLVVEDVVTCRS